MTLEMLWREAVMGALAALPVNRAGDGEGEGAAVPFAVLGEIVGTDWGAKERPGRALRFTVTLSDRGEAARIATLAEGVETVLAGMPRGLPGWELGGVAVLRSRTVRRRDGLRTGTIEARVRGWRV